MTRIPLKQIPDDDFKRLITQATSVKNFLETCGFSRNSGTMGNIVRDRINSLGLDVSHFQKRGKGLPRYSLEEILVEKSPYTNIGRLKLRLVSEGCLEYECAECKNPGIHNGKKLNLQLDHKNGVSNDHRLENLRFLCPNCHSQTSTFAGRNIKSSN